LSETPIASTPIVFLSVFAIGVSLNPWPREARAHPPLTVRSSPTATSKEDSPFVSVAPFPPCYTV